MRVRTSLRCNYSRRRFIGNCTAIACLAPAFQRKTLADQRPFTGLGYVVGEPTAELVGNKVLAEGGNAIDAIAAAALTAAVVAPNQTGIGGYGMSAMIALESGRRVVAVDGNSTAPAALQADFFRDISTGKEESRRNEVGWQAAGVPGIMAGLHLVIQRFGTRQLDELMQPAIGFAQHGFAWPASLSEFLRNNRDLPKDPGSHRLYYPNGQPIVSGSTFRNPELAYVLKTIAQANSVEPFYRGDIAQRIADGFQKNGGLVTVDDLAAYEAKLVTPLSMECNGFQIQTPPLTAGGLTVLQVLHCLNALGWRQLESDEQRLHAKLEATRLAWNDRLTLLGDPEFAAVPIERLLSKDYAVQSTERIRAAISQRTYLRYPEVVKPQSGTISLSLIDQWGNMAALTLTHGEAFGAKVTVDGLGLTLGYGVSRFDTRPDHPNSPGPRKRPLHNMVPTIVSRDGEAIMAVGGRGGRKIVNAVLEVLVQFVENKHSLALAMAAPRFHTEGNASIQFEASWPEVEIKAVESLGYSIGKQASATLSAVAVEDGRLKAAVR